MPGTSHGQGSLACCSPWGHKELDMTERLNKWNSKKPCSVFSKSPVNVLSYFHNLKKCKRKNTHKTNKKSHTNRSQCGVEDFLGSFTTDPQDAELVVRIGKTKAMRLAEQGAEETWLLTPGPCSAQTVALHTWVLSSTRQSKRGPTPN